MTMISANPFKFEHVLDTEDISLTALSLLLETTEKVQLLLEAGVDVPVLRQKILATIFFEPSTRTRLSFESAMLRFDGKVITVEQAISSSIEKGETLEDMGAVVSGYADAIVMRHPEPGSVSRFAKHASVPVINAGDGDHQHPTQAFVDLYTIYHIKKAALLNKRITFGFLGDLKYSRTIHSLIFVLTHYGVKFRFISPKQISLDDSLIERLESLGADVAGSDDLQDFLPDLDVLYVTRLQKERFRDPNDYEELRQSYQINGVSLQHSKPDMMLLHPLPRVDEIAAEIDLDPRAMYFQQAQNGIYLRMALLALVLGKEAEIDDAFATQFNPTAEVQHGG